MTTDAQPSETLPRPRRALSPEAWISTTYEVVSIAWIILSDLVLTAKMGSAREQAAYSISKGIAFVTVTAMWLYASLRWALGRERKTAVAARAKEAALRESEEKLKLALSAAQMGTWDWDPTTGEFLCSERCRAILGLPGDEAMSYERLLGAIHAQDRTRVDQAVKGALVRASDYEEEMRIPWPDGTVRWAEAKGRGIRDARDGVRVVGTVVDVTAHREAEEALRESEERFRAMSSIGTEGIMVHAGGRILDTNRAFANLAGFRAPEALIGKNGFEVIPLTPASKRLVEEHIRSGSTDTYDIEMIRADGSILPAETSGRSIVYRGIKARLVTLRDVTQRKGADAERARIERSLRLSQKMESIGQLAGGLAHDFNNSLAVIMACTDELMEVVPDVHRPRVAEITAAARSSAGLVRHLLAFARKEPTVDTPVDVAEVLRQLGEMLRRVLPKNIEVAVSGAEGREKVVVQGNRTAIEHALLNLALNARDAMPSGGNLLLSCRVRSLEVADLADWPRMQPGPVVQIDVEDTGTGIAPEVLPHIFEPLFSTKPAEKGTGLGLSSVFGVVRGHQGDVRVWTEVGRGSRFSLVLPVGRKDGSEASPSGAHLVPPSP